MKTKTTIPSTPGFLQLPAKFIGAASTDKTREVINGVLVDAENRAVVATNGRILARIPIPGTAAIRGGYISPELWKSATIMAKKGPVILDYVHGTIATLPYPSIEEWGQNYPNWQAVIPKIENPCYRTRIDPKLLLDCALALGYNPEDVNCKGVTFDFAPDHDSPILLNVHGDSTGVISAMGDKDNKCGHGLRIALPAASSPAEATPERSPAFTPTQLAPFKLDRSEMLRDPIAWLRRLDEELRYLTDFTPDGRYIYDYLTIGERAAEADEAEIERDENKQSLENAEEDAEELKKFITSILKKLEELNFASPDALATSLEGLAFFIHREDTEFAFDYENLSSRIEGFGEIALPKSEADFESMKAERDQFNQEASDAFKRIIQLEKDLTQARNRIIALETAAKHRKAIDDHQAAKVQPATEEAMPERSPVAPATRPPVLSRNEPKNGIELRFDGKPDDATRAALKEQGFRWCPGQPDKPWVARYTEERWVFAMKLADASIAAAYHFGPPATEPAKPQATPSPASAFADF